MYDAPIQMLADNPVFYLHEDTYTKFLTQIPTTWDTTIGVDGKIGQYAVMARRHDHFWYIGALNDWGARTLETKTDFLQSGKPYTVRIVSDGINAENYPSDYVLRSIEIRGGETLKIEMAPGGGWAAIISPLE